MPSLPTNLDTISLEQLSASRSFCARSPVADRFLWSLQSLFKNGFITLVLSIIFVSSALQIVFDIALLYFEECSGFGCGTTLHYHSWSGRE